MARKLIELIDYLKTVTTVSVDDASVASDIDVTGITDDSRKVRDGNVFVAYPGETVDGRAYIAQAIAQGACAVIVDAQDFDVADSAVANLDVPVICVADLRDYCGGLAACFYGFASQKLRVIGVTGTNGKTSVAYLLTQLLTRLGYKAYMIGTLGMGALDNLDTHANTTPGAIVLQERLAAYVAQSVEYVVMEVSSIAVDQGRIHGVDFEVAAFTNFSRDHLDYHKTMDAYAQAKTDFVIGQGRNKVVNTDDALGQRLADALVKSDCITVGQHGQLRARNVTQSLSGMAFRLETGAQQYDVQSPLVGAFNRENLLVVLGVAQALNLDMQVCVAALRDVRAPVGRLECFVSRCACQDARTEQTHFAIVDYAHTPDALAKLLAVVKAVSEQAVHVVFGCGGDRDAGKRALMAHAAEQSADAVWLTSDNPRSESPQAIIDDVMAGFEQPERVHVVVDRKEAIAQAAATLQANDVLVVAGKGHEDYQEIHGVKHPFSDQTVLKSLGFTHAFVGEAA